MRTKTRVHGEDPPDAPEAKPPESQRILFLLLLFLLILFLILILILILILLFWALISGRLLPRVEGYIREFPTRRRGGC
jgi:hypothetical protein